MNEAELATEAVKHTGPMLELAFGGLCLVQLGVIIWMVKNYIALNSAATESVVRYRDEITALYGIIKGLTNAINENRELQHELVKEVVSMCREVSRRPCIAQAYINQPVSSRLHVTRKPTPDAAPE
jgi:hypothetical protein